MLIFVFIGGIALVTAFTLRVNVIKFSFSGVNNINQERATLEYTQRVGAVAKGKNMLFALDRPRVKEVIEADPLARVTSIHAKFPDKLQIDVEERAPMYFFRHGDDFAVLDRELQVISVNANLKNRDVPVDITDQFTMPDDFTGFTLGQNFNDLVAIEDTEKARVLVDMLAYFLSKKNPRTETELCYLMRNIVFTNTKMTIKLEDPKNLGTNILIELKSYAVDFAKKLDRAWSTFEAMSFSVPGIIIVSANLADDIMFLPSNPAAGL